MQVSIQGGHKEQAFRKRHCAATAKPLQRAQTQTALNTTSYVWLMQIKIITFAKLKKNNNNNHNQTLGKNCNLICSQTLVICTDG